MTQAAPAKLRRDLLSVMRAIPAGRVASIDDLCEVLKRTPREVQFVLARLNDDDRETAPWHRVVAKGGAIGWGPQRDAQFAKLMREGVMMSPAGIVQDMATRCMSGPELSGDALACKPGCQRSVGPSADTSFEQLIDRPLSRSRGMKDRPGS